MITIWGLKNCDTCRKARKWLDDAGCAYHFSDVRTDGLGEARIADWMKAVGLDVLINRRGTTWRNLPEDMKENVCEENAPSLLAEYPALMKRPIFETGTSVLVGFSEDVKSALKSDV